MNKTWWKECVVYQVYPRSFKDSNGDGIGDLNGVTEKLDYIKRLGADVIWLSPIYQSPNDDNGYDISDYCAIMDEFGTMEDFDRLLQEAHRRGLKIMLDVVVNHTSDEHHWFAESRSSKTGKYRDYYIWRKGRDGGPPNNWGANFGGSAWEYSAETDMYYLHLFSKKQPDLNWEQEAVRRDVKDMMMWWLEKGVDGFRLDVINLISKDPELPDGIQANGDPYGDHNPYTANGPRVHEYLQELNRDVFQKYDMMTVGETIDTTPEDALTYAALDSSELNMIFTFEHMNVGNENGSKWTDKRFSLVELKQILSKWQTILNGKAWNSLYWNNHDQPRAVSRFGDDRDYWNRSAKMLAVCLHMMQGTPYIYQGEEIGMTNIALDHIDEYQDIETKTAFDKYTRQMGIDEKQMMRAIRCKSRDNARSPMQWDDSSQAGFTDGQPWFQVNPNYVRINAAGQIDDPDSIFNFYRRVIALRKAHPIIVYGDYRLLDETNEHVYTYMRTLGGERLLVMCNFSNEIQVLEPEQTQGEGTYQILLSNYEQNGEISMEDSISLQPYEAVVLYQNN